MSTRSLESSIQFHRDQIDDYESSVRGLYAFANSACWDEELRQRRPDSKFSIPRSMTKRDDKSGDTLTPDAVIQVTPGYGLIAEMKKHFQVDDLEAFEQIKKYDQVLIGWWPEANQIENHDLVLLTHYLSAEIAKDTLNSWMTAGGSYERNFAIVEYNYVEQGKLYFTLKKVHGTLSDPAHDEALRKVKPIPEGVAILLFSKYKFSDAVPPLMHMLVTIHNCVLTLFSTQEQFEALERKNFPTIEVTSETVREKMQEQFCPERDATRQPGLPKIEWVEDALDTFVKMELAFKDPRNKGTYRVVVKQPPKKDVVEYFTAKLIKIEEERAKKTKPASPAQPSLFSALDSGQENKENNLKNT